LRSSAQDTLREGSRQLQTSGDSQRRGILDWIFGGTSKKAVSIAEPSAEATAAVEPSAPELGSLSLGDLQGRASDSAKPYEERLSALKAIAKKGGPEAMDALEQIGNSNPDGGAKDYEMRRQALRALAGLGKLVALGPVSQAHEDEILKGLELNKPDVTSWDHDDTIEKMGEPASAETGAALKAVADVGIEVMVNTDRTDKTEKGEGILDLYSALKPEQRQAITFAPNRGARLWIYDSKDQSQLLREEPTLGASQEAIAAASQAVWAKYPAGVYKGGTGSSDDYRVTILLQVGTGSDQIEAAATLFKEELARRGIYGGQVMGKKAVRDTDPPYITYSRLDKSLGVRLLRENREFFIRLRDAYRLLPAWLSSLARRLLLHLPSAIVPAERTLLIGDQFFGKRNVDLAMIKGAPGAITLALGGSADPHEDNVFVLKAQGHAGAMKIAAALAKPLPQADAIYRRAIYGLFVQRTMSIIAFIGTAIAYPFIAIPAVGVVGFGVLMAFGPFGAIATGPLNGIIAKKFSSRNAMVLNTLVRTALNLLMPVLSLLGFLAPSSPLAFASLLAVSIANGWNLSSVMTTEDIFINRFSGKHLKTFIALAWMNALTVQVILTLIFGLGGVIDHWNPLIPYYVSVAAHLFVILPIVLWTIPNELHLVQKAAGALKLRIVAAAYSIKQKVVRVAYSLWDYRIETILLMGGLALYPILHTPIPATLALIFWISRTEGFGLLRQNRSLYYGLFFYSLLPLIIYPLQSYLLPLMAKFLAGEAGKAQLYGELFGALLFGQLIANSAQARLPLVSLPLLGRFGGQRLIQAGVLGLMAVWVYTKLIAGSILATAVALAAGAVLMALSAKMDDRSRILFIGVGIPFILLPLFFWGNIPILFASLLIIGFAYGPAMVVVNNDFNKRLPEGQKETLLAIKGSMFNAANSLGYGAAALAAIVYEPLLPGILKPMAFIYILAALAFVFFYDRFVKVRPL
jgi:hypothetical protein